jgi:ABC-type multidrug transport system fused ATPase/permease subunit
VLHEGHIVEQGTHTELIKKGGYYSRLVEMQDTK